MPGPFSTSVYKEKITSWQFLSALTNGQPLFFGREDFIKLSIKPKMEKLVM